VIPFCVRRRTRSGKPQWVPKYAPELNDIETVWGDLAHQTFTDPDVLDEVIHHSVAALNSERKRDA
jgi:hypothetical protein